jgi:hypothetical protein
MDTMVVVFHVVRDRSYMNTTMVEIIFLISGRLIQSRVDTYRGEVQSKTRVNHKVEYGLGK